MDTLVCENQENSEMGSKELGLETISRYMEKTGPRADIYKTNLSNEEGQMPRTQSKLHCKGNVDERQPGSHEVLLDPAPEPKARVSDKNQSQNKA